MKPNKKLSPIQEHLTPGSPKTRKPAPTVYCYICGRQFGSASIGIHQPQCLKKWQTQNDKLPKAQRRPMPTPPEIVRIGSLQTHSILVDMNLGGAIDFEATNQAAYQASLAQLVPCENCGRKFAAERLAIHQRSCTKEHPAKRVETNPKRHHEPQLATSMAAKAKKAEQLGRAY